MFSNKTGDADSYISVTCNVLICCRLNEGITKRRYFRKKFMIYSLTIW